MTGVMQDTFLRDAVLVFLVAGRDTTADGIAWALYELVWGLGFHSHRVLRLKLSRGASAQVSMDWSAPRCVIGPATYGVFARPNDQILWRRFATRSGRRMSLQGRFGEFARSRSGHPPDAGHVGSVDRSLCECSGRW